MLSKTAISNCNKANYLPQIKNTYMKNVSATTTLLLILCLSGCSKQETDQSKKIDSLEKIISSKTSDNVSTPSPKEIETPKPALRTEDIKWRSLSESEAMQKINEIIVENNNGTNVGHVLNSMEQWMKFKDIMNNEKEYLYHTFTFKAQVEADENGEPFVTHDKDGGMTVTTSINGAKGDGAIWMVFTDAKAFRAVRSSIRGNETYAFKGMFCGVVQGSEFPYGTFIVTAIRKAY